MGQALIVALLLTTTLASAGEPLPGTKPLTLEGDIAAHLLDGAHKFVDREIERSVERRHSHWKNTASEAASFETARRRLQFNLGVVDRRVFQESSSLRMGLSEIDIGTGTNRVKFDNFESLSVTWPVVPGVQAYGKYLRPVKKDLQTLVIVLEDRDFTIGAIPATIDRHRRVRNCPASFLSERLANSGFHVVLPTLIGRDTAQFEIGSRSTILSRREFLHRQAFEVGRQVVGYDLQKTLALVDWATARQFKNIVVVGYGEGGVQALYAGALDLRISTVIVGASFGRRPQPWLETADRNIWGGISDFGDAELAAMIRPRSLFVHTIPNSGYLPNLGVAEGSKIAAPGVLSVPDKVSATKEWNRLIEITAGSGKIESWGEHHIESDPNSKPGQASVEWLAKKFQVEVSLDSFVGMPEPKLDMYSLIEFQVEEVDAWSAFTQGLVRESEYRRRDIIGQNFGKERQSRDSEQWRKATQSMKSVFYREDIGRFEHDLKPFNAQTRQVYDTDKYRGYEVTLDVFDDVIAYGVLLVPKDIQPGEKRPVVVCQHGLEGRPQDTIEKDVPGERYYHQFAVKLAERGFVTFAPQNLYIFKDRFRELQRKLNPLKKTLFSIIVPQHEQICRWLKSQPFVDGSRIGFYGLSYGGKTAMRVPPLVDHYACVICSGDFNDWIRKCTSIRDPFSYVGTGEYEIWEWNLANTFNYAEMAGLICPRPFMVERGHRDGVGIDEWVDYEYAKVRLLYVDLRIPERTEIEHFDGPHEINGVGSFKFLHKHLNWPEPTATAGKGS